MKSKVLMISFLVILVAGVVGVIAYDATSPGPYDDFAQCLTDNNVKMFGAYWCWHCQQTKDDFAKSFSKVDYIECSLPNRGGQTQECASEGITGYPTWEINEQRYPGYQAMETLSDLSGCSL